MRQPIGSRLHGALDYLTGTSLIAASRLPVLRDELAGNVLLGAGANHLAYSLVTDYELSPVRKLPYRAHLAVDAAGALGLIALGATRKKNTVDRWVLIGVGLYELSAVLMSDPAGQGAGGPEAEKVDASAVNGKVYEADPIRNGRTGPVPVGA